MKDMIELTRVDRGWTVNSNYDRMGDRYNHSCNIYLDMV
jgi:hypothetical protein